MWCGKSAFELNPHFAIYIHFQFDTLWYDDSADRLLLLLLLMMSVYINHGRLYITHYSHTRTKQQIK